MLDSVLRCGWIRSFSSWSLLMLGFVCSASAQDQFVFVNNDGVPNTISAFHLDSQGVVVPVPGSPFPTGGLGRPAYEVFTNASIVVKNDLLFACNVLGNSVSVFAVAPDGSLSAVPGSPFPTGGRSPLSLAADPLGTLLFVSNHDTARLTVFRVNPDGTLAPLPGSPFLLSPLRTPTGMVLNSTGTLLVIGGDEMLGVYRVGAQGQVSLVGDLVNAGVRISSLSVTDDDQYLYAAGDRGIAGFEMSPDGQLTQLNGSPFPAPSSKGVLGLSVQSDMGVVLATVPEDAKIYNYRIQANGTLRRAAGGTASGGGTELRPIHFDATGQFVLSVDVVEHTIEVHRIVPLTRNLNHVGTAPLDTGDARARPSGIAVK